MNNSISLTLLYLALSLAPAVIWIALMFRKGDINKKIMALIFLGGTAALIPLFILQYLWITDPIVVDSYRQTIIDFSSRYLSSVNFSDWIGYFANNIFAPAFQEILIFTNKLNAINFLQIAEKSWKLSYLLPAYVFFAMLEEIFKQWILRSADKKYLIVRTINDSIKYSIVAGLGFSFAENIMYFKALWGTDQFISAYIFRIIFTSAGHMAFSGIFGYYYGISKFAITFKKAGALEGKKVFLGGLANLLFGYSGSEVFRNQLILKGLVAAMVLHGLFNTSVQFSEVYRIFLIGAILLIVGIYIYALLLLSRKAGNLVLAADISTGQVSTIAKKDEDIVLELIGMWMNEKRYVDVIHICERLLERAPNNNIVKLFKSKAMDQVEGNTPAAKILTTLFPDKKTSTGDKSVIDKYKPSSAPQDFQTSEKFQEFKKREEEARAARKTYKLDIK